MITGRDIIFISSIEWNFLWQIHQEIASRLAKAGNRVLYIENTGVRSPGLRDAGRIALRLRHWIRALRSHGVREVAPNIYVTSPLVLPSFGPSWRRLINRRFLLPIIKRTARKLGMNDPLLWTYLPTDTAATLIHMLRTKNSVVVYYCGADFSQLTPSVEQFRQSEAAILEQSDLVFTFCSQLVEHCRKWNDNVHIVPAGVDMDAFPAKEINHNDGEHSSAVFTSTKLAVEQTFQSLPRPVIGYVGGLHKLVDYDLLVEMARERPQWSWVFVGPVQAEVGDLAKLPNIYLLGQKSHRDLVHYIRHFDVCLIPYLNNSSTATALPLKLNEYLAVGKPIVSTDLPTVLDFNLKHKILITSASKPEYFLQAIEQALCLHDDEDTIARRREVAALGDWQACLNSMSEWIEAKMREK
jgi:glycosyltransferase involved in cell wall biosynthesis